MKKMNSKFKENILHLYFILAFCLIFILFISSVLFLTVNKKATLIQNMNDTSEFIQVEPLSEHQEPNRKWVNEMNQNNLNVLSTVELFLKFDDKEVLIDFFIEGLLAKNYAFNLNLNDEKYDSYYTNLEEVEHYPLFINKKFIAKFPNIKLGEIFQIGGNNSIKFVFVDFLEDNLLEKEIYALISLESMLKISNQMEIKNHVQNYISLIKEYKDFIMDENFKIYSPMLSNLNSKTALWEDELKSKLIYGRKPEKENEIVVNNDIIFKYFSEESPNKNSSFLEKHSNGYPFTFDILKKNNLEHIKNFKIVGCVDSNISTYYHKDFYKLLSNSYENDLFSQYLISFHYDKDYLKLNFQNILKDNILVTKDLEQVFTFLLPIGLVLLLFSSISLIVFTLFSKKVFLPQNFKNKRLIYFVIFLFTIALLGTPFLIKIFLILLGINEKIKFNYWFSYSGIFLLILISLIFYWSLKKKSLNKN